MTSTQPPLPSFNLDNHVQQAWEFYHTTLHSPTNFAAPMVDQSELQYRLLTRRHNTHVCYTPMFHSRLMTEDVKYRQKVMYDLRCSDTTTSIDRPLLVQFCGNNPDTVLSAAKHVENHCDAVDLNLGCPQGIARKGNYGSFLMPETDLLVRIVQNLHSNLNIPVTCKIRLFPKIQDTIRLAKALESAGCYMLCIHGRTKEEKKMLTKETHFDEIRQVKQALRIPVISNGGVGSRNDVIDSLIQTETHGIMSAEYMLENPTLFAQPIVPAVLSKAQAYHTASNSNVILKNVMSRATEHSNGNTFSSLKLHQRQLKIAKEYLFICKEHAPQHLGTVRSHLNKFLFCLFQHANMTAPSKLQNNHFITTSSTTSSDNKSSSSTTTTTTTTTAPISNSPIPSPVTTSWPETVRLEVLAARDSLNGLFTLTNGSKIRDTEKINTIDGYIAWVDHLSNLIAPYEFKGTVQQSEWYWRHRGMHARDVDHTGGVKRKREEKPIPPMPIPTFEKDKSGQNEGTIQHVYLALVMGGMCQFAKSEIEKRLNVDGKSICTIQHNDERKKGIGGEASVDKIIFQTNADVTALKSLRCIQALYGYLNMGNLDKGVQEEEGIQKCVELVVRDPNSLWNSALNLWKKWSTSKNNVWSKQNADKKTWTDGNEFKFRASTVRDGKHKFNSYGISGAIGYECQQKYGWKVDLEKYDLVVTTLITQHTVIAGIMLHPDIYGCLRSSKIPSEARPLLEGTNYQRAATLRPSTAQNMLLLANVQPGEIVIDCMCGIGTLPLEVASMRSDSVARAIADAEAASFNGVAVMEPSEVSSKTSEPSTASTTTSSSSSSSSSLSSLSSSKINGCDVFVMGGDVLPAGVKIMHENSSRPELHSPVASVVWDSRRLPLRDNLVDVMVVDMPFGMSCKLKKKDCYKIIAEMGRVLKQGGRAILLYQARKSFREAIKRTQGVLNIGKVIPVNIGGLIVGLHVVWKGPVPIVLNDMKMEKKKEENNVQEPDTKRIKN